MGRMTSQRRPRAKLSGKITPVNPAPVFLLKYNPWIYFLVTALCLSALSYGTFHGEWALGIGVLGLLFPTFWAFQTASAYSPSESKWFQKEWLPPKSLWFLASIAVLAVLARLYQLTSLASWPTFDEGLFSFISIGLLKKWDGKFFYSFAQVPFAFNWSLALFYKLLTPSLFSLWLYPALASILTLLVSFFAVRSFFSRTFSFFFFLLFSFSFWHLYLSRFCMGMVLAILWEMLVLGALGLFLKCSEGPSKRTAAYVLGFLTGSCVFVFTQWPVILALVSWVIYKTRAKKGMEILGGPFLRFIGPVLFLFFLFLLAALHDHYGDHIRGLWALNGNSQWEQQFLDILCYPKMIFFQPGDGKANWLAWGGYLNPLAGSLCLVGILEIFRLRKFPLARWFWGGLFLCLMPGFLAKNVEIFRILPVFPVITVLCAFGAMALLKTAPPAKAMAIVMAILVLSSVVDLYHLFGPYHRMFGIPNPYWAQVKSEPFFKAYQILRRDYQPQGPGGVLTDLWAHSSDETLTLATYAFNTVRNPSLSTAQSRWVAVFMDANYKPFLARRFPQGRWFWLGSLSPNDESGLVMGVIPVSEGNRTALLNWVKADQELQPVTSWIMSHAPWASREAAIELLNRSSSSMRGDPFLQSCFWEKVYVEQSDDNNHPGMLETLQRGLINGYPLAHFYNEEGMLLQERGRSREARAAFEKALHSPLNLTSAGENLKILESSNER
jgi:hypothetical protein